MKKTYMSILLVLALAVFVCSFFIGRATALKDSKERTMNDEIYKGTINIPKNEKKTEEKTEEAGAVAENVNKHESSVKKNEEVLDIGNLKEEEKPPERMLFPCGQAILKSYSQTAVYSKTMDDWRAHTGIDYKAQKGTEVISVWDGSVRKVYNDKLWGYVVEIVHSGDLCSIYKNLEENILVKDGDKVKKGQVIGKVGESAAVESREEPHLHFELWTGGQPINPESYVY